jgi:hypothetical protein
MKHLFPQGRSKNTPYNFAPRQRQRPSELTTPKHDVVHDMESIFWCLNYICLCRDGPGTVRPEVLKMLNPREHTLTNDEIRLRDTIQNFFASPPRVSGMAKGDIIKLGDPLLYENDILSNISPFFAPLSPLLKEFLLLLHNSYKYPGTATELHDKVLALFRKAYNDMHDLLESVKKYNQRAISIQKELKSLAEVSDEEKDTLLARWHTDEHDSALRQKHSEAVERILKKKSDLEDEYLFTFDTAPCLHPSVQAKWDQMADEVIKKRTVGAISSNRDNGDILDVLVQDLGVSNTIYRARESVGDSPTPVTKRARIS